MNIDLPGKMTNGISEFFGNDIADHLRAYWEPRMRAQMLEDFEQRQGRDLTDLARSAVAVLPSRARGEAAAKAAG